MPVAIRTAFAPTMPPPITATTPGAAPGTPDSSTPRPPLRISSACMPTWIASRPAIWDIGASSGVPPDGDTTVSYAMPVTPRSSSPRAIAGAAARCR